jgi:hypothetical protein
MKDSAEMVVWMKHHNCSMCRYSGILMGMLASGLSRDTFINAKSARVDTLKEHAMTCLSLYYQ